MLESSHLTNLLLTVTYSIITILKKRDSITRIVLDMETCCCLGPERNGVSIGGGGKGRPSPPERGKDKHLMPNRGRDNMGKDEEEQPNRM